MCSVPKWKAAQKGVGPLVVFPSHSFLEDIYDL